MNLYKHLFVGIHIQKKIEPVVLDTVQRKLLLDRVLEVAQTEMRRLLKEEKRRRANASPKADVRRQLEECQRRIDRLSVAVDATDSDIEELVSKLAAMDEREELEPKLGTTTREALKELSDDVFGGLRYYRDQVAAMADPTGIHAADVEKRALLEKLLGEITVRRRTHASANWSWSLALERRPCRALFRRAGPMHISW